MTKQKAKELIEQAGGTWEVFCHWMTGQTVGVYPNGKTNYYEGDVRRFIRYKCNPGNEPSIEFD